MALGFSWPKQEDNTYFYSRSDSADSGNIVNVACDIVNGLDISMIPKKSISMLVYVASEWSLNSELTVEELDSYFNQDPRGFLHTFHSLSESTCLSEDCLVVGVGSTASEAATCFAYNSSAGMYSVSKMAQKALVIQLARKHKRYRYLNLTLGSINNDEGAEGVGYQNIVDTIHHHYVMNAGFRYSDAILVSALDMAST
jgi:hypothetical protein